MKTSPAAGRRRFHKNTAYARFGFRGSGVQGFRGSGVQGFRWEGGRKKKGQNVIRGKNALVQNYHFNHQKWLRKTNFTVKNAGWTISSGRTHCQSLRKTFLSTCCLENFGNSPKEEIEKFECLLPKTYVHHVSSYRIEPDDGCSAQQGERCAEPRTSPNAQRCGWFAACG